MITMSSEIIYSNNKTYYQVVDGSFRTKVDQGHPDAVSRVNKNNKLIYERVVSALRGRIQRVSLRDSDFGKQVVLEFDSKEDGTCPILSFSVEGKNGRDILRKLPAVDFSQEVLIFPYRYIPDGQSDEVSGISIKQKDKIGEFTVKISNHFFDADEKKYLHGFPETLNWETASEEDKKIFKIKRDAFLVSYLKENILPRFAEKNETPLDYPTESFSPEEIPF